MHNIETQRKKMKRKAGKRYEILFSETLGSGQGCCLLEEETRRFVRIQKGLMTVSRKFY
jgi:hypothetical protein